MGKKKKSKKNETKQENEVVLDNVLPQNIVAMGEHVEENKNIYISQSVYKEIHKFTKDKTTNESGGMLIGNVIEEFGKTNIVIHGFIEAKHCEATPTTLTFTHETWEYVHKEMDKKFKQYKIVGWIHTHPNFGIFLSEYDKFIQENFFKEENQIAYVVDPIQGIEGFYFWINDKIERCKGFYIFDKNDTKITIKEELEESEEEEPEEEKESSFWQRNSKFIFLWGVIAILLVVCFNLNRRINIIEQQMLTLVDSANNSLAIIQQRIIDLESKLQTPSDANQSNTETNNISSEETQNNQENNEV